MHSLDLDKEETEKEMNPLRETKESWRIINCEVSYRKHDLGPTKGTLPSFKVRSLMIFAQ